MRRRQLVAGVGLAASGCLRLQGGGPTAVFTYEPTEPAVGEPVTFDGSASGVPDGEIVQYSWVLLDENDGVVDQFGSTVRTTHAFDAPGDHRVGLEIVDDQGATARTAQTVTVTA